MLLLPGPPRELQAMFTALVREVLNPRSPGRSLVRRIVRIARDAPSRTRKRPCGRCMPSGHGRRSRSAATILASLGQIELHLSARAASPDRAAAAVEAASRQVADVLGLDAYSLDGRPLEQVVGDLLVERRFRIALAESCTGGLLSSRLTDIAGKLPLCGEGGGRLRQRGQGVTPWRSPRVDRRARRGERTCRARDGGGRSGGCDGRCRRRRDRHRGSGGRARRISRLAPWLLPL